MEVCDSIYNAKLLNFEYIKELYMNDHNFNKFYHVYEKVEFEKYFRHNGFLFRGNRLCVPMSSMHELLVMKAYEDGLIGLFGVA